MEVYIQQAAFRIPGANSFKELNQLLASNQCALVPWKERFSGVLKKDALMSEGLDTSSKAFRRIDRVAQLAVVLTHDLASFAPDLLHIGSARGATETWEKEHASFLAGKRISVHTSPNTTLGNIAFNAARIANLSANVLDQSMTCSSGLHSVVEAVRRLKMGEIQSAIAGGVEAPLTDFTYAQFEALKLLSKSTHSFPCQPLSEKNENQLVLAEGGALFALAGNKSDVQLLGYGESLSKTKHNLAFGTDALKEAMMKALRMSERTTVDAVLMHAPGTIQGDQDEVKAVKEVLDPNVRMIPTKWLTGHTLGASGAISMVLAMALLNGESLKAPYAFKNKGNVEDRVETVLVNATGFGGNAVSILLGKSNY